MFALVEDIEQYPQFVPWISAATMLESTPEQVTGKLEMHKAGVRETFTTRNFLKRPTEMLMTLVDGPFKTFEGRWTFTPLRRQGCEGRAHGAFRVRQRHARHAVVAHASRRTAAR